MDFQEAILTRVPLQLRIPNPRRPLEICVHPVAEAFLVETIRGPGVIWLDPFWCDSRGAEACHIAYASPQYDPRAERWIDPNPRYGPKCLAYQKPFVVELLNSESPAGDQYQTWLAWRKCRSEECDRAAAWASVQRTLGHLIKARRV